MRPWFSLAPAEQDVQPLLYLIASPKCVTINVTDSSFTGRYLDRVCYCLKTKTVVVAVAAWPLQPGGLWSLWETSQLRPNQNSREPNIVSDTAVLVFHKSKPVRQFGELSTGGQPTGRVLT